MTRIIAGRFGGRRLAVPPSGTRPTSDRAREAIFSTLEALLGGLRGVAFLDLYAGSGAIGIEAWSRGAEPVVLVESAPRAVATLRSNLANLANLAELGNLRADLLANPTNDDSPGGEPPVIVAAKVETAVAELSPSGFDVVFADPPYGLPANALCAVLRSLAERGLLKPDAVIAVERASRDTWAWPPGIVAVRERRYGDATISYGRALATQTDH
jgi:16S rRNA (guanine966-N2)-methyltransferase